MNLSRPTKAVVAPAILAALALSACQDEAPEAKAPASPTQEQTQAQPGDQSQDSGSDSDGAGASPQGGGSADAPDATQAEPSEDGGDSAPSSSSSGKCQSSSSYKIVKNGVEAKPIGTKQVGKADIGDGTVEISIGKPTIDTSGGDDYFPGEGMQTAIYPVTLKHKSGRSYVSGGTLSFGLVDADDAACAPDTLKTVVPRHEQPNTEIMKSGDAVSKKLAFAVPAGADLSKYSVVFADDYSSGQAELAWKGK